jgi:hypothetical protein
LILVSSVTTWANTPKKIKKNFPRAKAEDSDVEEEMKQKKWLREDESDSEGRNPLKKIPENEKVLYFTDADY